MVHPAIHRAGCLGVGTVSPLLILSINIPPASFPLFLIHFHFKEIERTFQIENTGELKVP
jgi:hypothetical protein